MVTPTFYVTSNTITFALLFINNAETSFTTSLRTDLASSYVAKVSLEKQGPHGLNWSCSDGGICLQKWKNHHLAFIISVFAWKTLPPFMKTIGASDVAKMGVSLLSSMSRLEKFFGAGK